MRVLQAILAAGLVFASSATAFWRMPCRFQTGVGRVDPLMDPGEIACHVHTITGGGGMGFSAKFETLTANGSCTACDVTQDHSAYWTPQLYFMYDNGTTVAVEQVGGILAYYLPYLSNITAFPEGFVMIAGDLSIRNFTGPFPDTPLSFWPQNPTDQFFLQQRALGFNCLNYAVAPEPSLYRHVLPSKEYMDAHCTDGLRLELAFPSCGNGSTDSSDHKSHVAYPNLVKEGNCPEEYSVHYPFLYFETIFNTYAFMGEGGQFILSHGDPVGTGYHGDFMMGWESAEFLQSALDTCTNPSGEIQDCALFDIQDEMISAQCTFPMPECLLSDEALGPRDGLPVDIPIQYGPEQATTYLVAGRSGQPTTTLRPSPPPPGFSNRPTLTYSSADPESTRTALGGIVVAMFTSLGDVETAIEVPMLTVTNAPSVDSARSQQDIVATSYFTTGSDVVEVVIEQVDVTIITTAAAEPTDSKIKRHIHHHAHQRGRL